MVNIICVVLLFAGFIFLFLLWKAKTTIAMKVSLSVIILPFVIILCNAFYISYKHSVDYDKYRKWSTEHPVEAQATAAVISKATATAITSRKEYENKVYNYILQFSFDDVITALGIPTRKVEGVNVVVAEYLGLCTMTFKNNRIIKLDCSDIPALYEKLSGKTYEYDNKGMKKQSPEIF
jgi:hypothetical protein